MPADDEDDDVSDANTVLAGSFASYQEAMEYGLVILAMQAGFWYAHGEEGHELHVEPELLVPVQAEFAEYAEEQAQWQQRPQVDFVEKPASFYVPYLLTLLLIGSFVLQMAYAPGYTEHGRMDAVGLLGRGEWWRPFTALFLHGDALHLFGNLVFGIWYGHLVNGAYGTLRGWSLILLSGILGNVLGALYHYPQAHLSIGASTAVFGALGLLVGHGTVHGLSQGWQGLRQALVPLIAGGVLLGLTGGYDSPEIDALAHTTGFIAGFLLGLPLAPRPERTSA